MGGGWSRPLPGQTLNRPLTRNWQKWWSCRPRIGVIPFMSGPSFEAGSPSLERPTSKISATGPLTPLYFHDFNGNFIEVSY